MHTLNEGLTNFRLTISKTLILNEIGELSPYKLFHEGGKFSGFSFGGLQWDLANHTPLPGAVGATDIFTQILQQATYPADFGDDTSPDDVARRGQAIFTTEEIQTILGLSI